jgi:hypothetical protein
MYTPRKGLRGYRIIILAILGAILAVFGALWVSVIFPAVDKMPGDYEATYYFGGQFEQMDPATMGMVTIPVEQTRAQKAVGTQDGALLIHEVRTVKNAVTGEDLSAIYGEESTVAVNPRNNEFITEVDEMGRWGYYGPPRPLAAGDTINIWNPGAGQPLPAIYAGEETFRGLNVYVFETAEQGINIGKEPTSGMDLIFDIQMTLWVEPSSGTVVDQTSETVTSINFMGTLMPVNISTTYFAEETIVEMMDIARSASWLLLWFRTLVPWIAIGLGCVLVSFCAVTVAVRNLRKARAGKPVEQPSSLHLDV